MALKSTSEMVVLTIIVLAVGLFLVGMLSGAHWTLWVALGIAVYGLLWHYRQSPPIGDGEPTVARYTCPFCGDGRLLAEGTALYCDTCQVYFLEGRPGPGDDWREAVSLSCWECENCRSVMRHGIDRWMEESPPHALTHRFTLVCGRCGQEKPELKVAYVEANRTTNEPAHNYRDEFHLQ